MTRTPDFTRDAKAKFNELWGRDSVGWQHQEANRETEDPESWTKNSTVFKAYITHWGKNVFDIAMHTGDDAEICFESGKFEALDIESVKARADDIIKEFINAAIRNWMGFELTPTRPADELRFKQIATSEDHILYGLTEDGLVYEKASSSGWCPVSMVKGKG